MDDWKFWSWKTFANKLLTMKKSVHLDGDKLRDIWSDLGFSIEDRVENNLRIAKIAKMLSQQDYCIIISVICPYSFLRDKVREIIPDCKFVYVVGGKKSSKIYPFETPDKYFLKLTPVKDKNNWKFEYSETKDE
jgi:hypothetical protein